MSAVGEFLKEDRRLVADSHFAKIAVLRDKHHVLHDERSQSLSAVQVRTLAETAVRASDAHIMGIDKLANELASFCGSSLAPIKDTRYFNIDAVSDSDCRAALAAATNLAIKFRQAYRAVDTENTYYMRRLERALTALEKNVAEHSTVQDELQRVQNEADALTQRVRSCAESLRKHCGRHSLKKGKKNANTATELERSIATVLSQHDEMKKKVDAMAQELKSAKDDLASAQEQLADVEDLKTRLNEVSQKCMENDEKVEAVTERIRCGICEDDDKSVSFACGHMSCRECATKWGKCPMRCSSQRTGKPVKYFFPVFL